jgi:hypothetical protein
MGTTKGKKVNLSNEFDRILSDTGVSLNDISPEFQKFFISYLDLRDSILVKTLKEQLPVDENICSNIADKVYDKLAETIVPILGRLETLSIGQENIAKAVVELKGDTEHIKGKVKQIEESYQEVNEKIIQLKQNIPDEMESHLSRIQGDLAKMMIRNSWRSIIIRLAITAIITILLAFTLLPWYHTHYLENRSEPIPQTERPK